MNTEFEIELACVEISALSTIVISVYRAPCGNLEYFLEMMDGCLQFLSRLGKNLILGGDMNIHLEVEGNDYSALKFLLQSHGLFITNRDPTRGNSCLDTIATSLNTWEYKVTVIDPVIADHDAVVMDLRLEGMSDSETSQPDFGLASYRVIGEDQLLLLKAALVGVDWSCVLACHQPETAFCAFFDIFMDMFDGYFPKKIRNFRGPSRKHRWSGRSHDEKSWFTPRLTHIRNLIVALHARVRLSNDEEDKIHLRNQYLRAKKIYRAEIDAAKKAANMIRIESAGNPCKAAWDLVNHVSKVGSRPKCKATPDEFNSFFIGEVERIVESMDEVTFDVPGCGSNHLRFERWEIIRPSDVIRVIRSFKNSPSPDIYGVTVGVMKFVADAIAVPLSHVLDVCLRNGCFPDALKLSRTIPVYKKGDPESMNNYRPISIIPVMGKVLETLMKEQLVSYFEENCLFSDAQHGFRRGRSTVTAVSGMIDCIVDAFERRDYVHLVLADLSKAFDCVPHGILLKKLESFGLCGSVLVTLISYLTGRKQVVSIGGALSQPIKVDHGVPQGSVMGPLLFLVAINDLGLIGPVLMFADDATIYSRGQTVEEAELRAQRVFSHAKQWFAENRLCLNEGKTQQLVCGLRSLADSTHQAEVKLLGFIIDPKLSWAGHIEGVCSRLARVVYLLRRLRALLSQKDLIMVYHALFHSHLLYGLLLWGHAAGCKSVLLLQKKALRVIASVGYREHCRPIFVQLGILTIYNQYILFSLLHVKDTESRQVLRSDLHRYNTRRRLAMDIPRCRTSKKKDSFPIFALNLFNNLPASVRNLQGGDFRVKIVTWLKENPFYAMSEYFDAHKDNIA